MEEEHELREELDLNMNTVRQLERRLEASQDSIVDQQLTIEKFRELVRHLQVCIYNVHGHVRTCTYMYMFYT